MTTMRLVVFRGVFIGFTIALISDYINDKYSGLIFALD